MDKSPFISVIIPTYNRRQSLQNLMDCLRQQDFPGDQLEIIVVDDGSTDSTWDLLQSWEAQSWCICARQPRQGPGAARNLGAKIARGSILAFTDSDCLPEPGWISALVEKYTEPASSNTGAVGGSIRNLADGSWLRNFQARRGTDHIANQHPTPLYLDTANASILRTAFLTVGGFHPAYTWSEDVDMGFRLHCAGIGLATTPKAIVWHAGARSLAAYLKRSYNIGYAKCRLAILYPHIFYPPPPPGLRLLIRQWLDRRIGSDAVPRRKPGTLAGFCSRSFYNLVQILMWEKHFWTSTLVQQLRHYRQQNLNRSLVGLYLCLEWLCHLAHTTGSVTYLMRFTFRPEEGLKNV